MVLRSMVWMLEGAGVSAAGWRGGLRTQLLAGLYFWVLRDFLDDDSADLAKTMAALDRRLRRAHEALAHLEGREGERGRIERRLDARHGS